MRKPPAQEEKIVFWMGSSKRDLLEFPEPVIDEVGTALSAAQFDDKHPAAKALERTGIRRTENRCRP
jgi:phage-related protein